MGVQFIHPNSIKVRTTEDKREHTVLWAFCLPCASDAVLACFLEHQRHKRSSSYGSSDGRIDNRCSKLPSKQFLLNHVDPQSRLDGLCWPASFVQLPDTTENFKSGCITMHGNAHGVFFRRCILMSVKMESWNHFEEIRPQKKYCKYGHTSQWQTGPCSNNSDCGLIFFF